LKWRDHTDKDFSEFDLKQSDDYIRDINRSKKLWDDYWGKEIPSETKSLISESVKGLLSKKAPKEKPFAGIQSPSLNIKGVEPSSVQTKVPSSKRETVSELNVISEVKIAKKKR